MEKESQVLILGGMGPESTIAFCQALLDYTNLGEHEADHIGTTILNTPIKTSRINWIFNHQGTNPILYTLIQLLERTAIERNKLMAIPCNTVHADEFIEVIQNSIDIPIIHIAKVIRNFVKRNYPNIEKIGLLATDGTLKAKIYHNVFEKDKIEIITPNKKFQEKTMLGISQVKHGEHKKNDNAKNNLTSAYQYLKENGAEIIIAGCTEIPIVLKGDNIIDTIEILAKATISIIKDEEKYQDSIIKCNSSEIKEFPININIKEKALTQTHGKNYQSIFFDYKTPLKIQYQNLNKIKETLAKDSKLDLIESNLQPRLFITK